MRNMLKTIIIAAIVLCAHVSNRSALAHETDQFTLPEGREFADLGAYLNAWAFNAIENGMNKTNRRIAQYLNNSRGPSGLESLQSSEAIVRAVNFEFGNAYDVIEGLERRLYSKEMRQQYPGKVVGYKQQLGNIYQHVHFPLDPRQVFRIWHASTFMAYGTYIGTDKVGHFTDMGMHYYRAYNASRQNGASHKTALAEAVSVGTHGPLFSERGMVGYLSAGHYSNGDLAANYLGLLFYLNLTEPVVIKGRMEPAMLVRDGEFWKLAPHVRHNSDFFAIFVSDHLDEAMNPGLYESGMRNAVREAVQDRTSRILARRCDRHGNRRTKDFFDAVLKDMATYYGDDYGHEGTYDELISIGSACFDQFPPDANVTARNSSGYTPLHEAAARGELQTVMRLYDRGAEVNVKVRSNERYSSEWGNSPLHYAARDGRKEVAAYLILRGANVNAKNDRGTTPLHRGLAYRDIVTLLIENGADVNAADVRGNTPLHWAAEDGQTEIAELLLLSGANIRLRNNAGVTPLHAAAQHGSTETAHTLLNYGADHSAKTNLDLTPLHIAVASRSESLVDLLLSYKADVRAKDQFEWTPLHEAAERGLSQISSMLLEHGAELNLPNAHGNTPLHFAARQGRDAVVEVLLARGADVNVINNACTTALHEAALAAHEVIVAMLIDHGADRLIRDRAGMTPLQIASLARHSEVVELLRTDQAPALGQRSAEPHPTSMNRSDQ